MHLLLSRSTALGLGEEILKVLLGVGLAGGSFLWVSFLFWWHLGIKVGVRRGRGRLGTGLSHRGNMAGPSTVVEVIL